jgi:hypothetical protein
LIGIAAFGGWCTREMNEKRIGVLRIIGSHCEVFAACDLMPDVTKMSEGDARLRIQEIMASSRLNVTVLYDGNRIWSFTRIIRDFKRVLEENSTQKMTKNLYLFFSLCCGTIAHYDADGWSSEYPDNAALKQLFLRNELGKRVQDYIPAWKTDARKIVVEIERLLGIENRDTSSNDFGYRAAIA